MILVNFNFIGFAMLAISFGVAFGVGQVSGLSAEGPLMMIAGPLLIVGHVWYRMRVTPPNCFGSTHGGSLFWLPIWLWGAVWSVVGVVYVIQGS